MRFTRTRNGRSSVSRLCQSRRLTWSTSMPTSGLAAIASSHTRPASAVPMPATTAPTWCSTSGASTRYSAERVVCEVTDLVERYRHRRSGVARFQLSRGRASCPRNCARHHGFRRHVSLDIPGIHRLPVPHERRRSPSAGRERRLAHGIRHGVDFFAASCKLMNKRHQRVDEMYETARKAELGGIRVTFNLIFGYPGETRSGPRRNASAP